MGGRGGTDRAVSVTRACKCWGFKSVVWSHRKILLCPVQIPNKTQKIGVDGGTYPQGVCPPISHSVVASDLDHLDDNDLPTMGGRG